MKTTGLSKLGKLVLLEYLAQNPFNERILEIESSNERVNLDFEILDPTEETVFLESGFFKITKFYCWNPVMGMLQIKSSYRKTFLDAIPEANQELIVHCGILPTHLIKKTILKENPNLPGWAKGDSVCYMIYYIHPDQREAIEINYQSKSYAEAMQEDSDRIAKLTSAGKGSYA